MRQEIIQQAVRLLAEGAEVDFFAAKTKAAKNLGCEGRQDLPSNLEIETELKKYQSLFFKDTHPLVIKNKRIEALSTMKYFQQFEPRLVGSVLEGTASANSPIEIELFVDSLKDVTFFLLDNGIPYEMGEHQVRLNKRETKQIPVVYFSADDSEIEIRVFPHKYLKQKHLSPVSGLVENRASIKELEKLLGNL